MPRHLPLLADRSVAEAQANRILAAERFETKVLEEGAVSCAPGCSHCCYYPLSVTILEGISIYQWLQEHRLWTAKLRATLEQTKDQTWDLAPEVWLLSMIPCPLLSENRRCLAYEARPFLCRTMYSRSDPYYCHPHRIGAGAIINRSDEIEAVWSAEKTILKKHQLRQVLIPLSAAVLLGERISKGEVEIEDTNSALFVEHASR